MNNDKMWTGFYVSILPVLISSDYFLFCKSNI